MVLAHVLRDLEQRMTEALKNMMNVCLLQRKEISLQTSKRRRSQNLFYVVYICKSPNKRVEVENTLHLLFYIWKRRRQRRMSWREGLPIYDGIDLPVSLFRRNNLKSYPNIFSPNREINFCLRSFGKLQNVKALFPMQVTLLGMTMLLKEKQN